MPKKVCLFTGAGIGVPLKLPTTIEFNSLLSQLPTNLSSNINRFLGESKNDIEKVLYVLEEIVNPATFLSNYLSFHKQRNTHFESVFGAINQLQSDASSSIFNIKSALFDILEKYELADAFFLYSSILKEIKTYFNNVSISIFTTNYDLTFENGLYSNRKVIEELGINEIDFGFKFEYGKQIFNQESNFNWQEDRIEYLKLHGSLDWNIDVNNDCTRSGASTKPANPGDMPLLYPGYKGTPTKEPFVSIHEKLYSRLIDSDYVFVLGFAFRDPYINNIFEFALRGNKRLKIYVYNPCDLNKLPFESSLGNFILRFPKKIQHIRKGIELVNTPLNLQDVVPPF